MARRRLTNVFVVASLLLSTDVFIASAQVSPSPGEAGFQPNRDYLALLPFEFIDTASDNVMLSFTDLTLPGNAGRELRFVRTFSNNVAEDPSGPQWRFGLDGVPMRVFERPYPQTSIQPPGSIAAEQLTTPYFWMLDGSRMKTTYVDPPNPALPPSLQNVRSHTFWHYNRPSKTLKLPDGTVAEYCQQTDTDCPENYLKGFSDPFGNAVTLTWTPGILQVVQSLGNGQSRQVFVEIDEATGLPTSLTYNGKTWTYIYPVPGQLATVVLPVGLQWTFAYSNEQFSQGKVTRVTTPQNGTVEYTYEDREFYTGGMPQIFNVLVSRRLYDAGELVGPPWTFTHFPGQGSDITQVTLPSGTKVTYTYGAYSNPNTLAGTWQLRFRYVQAPDGTTVEQEERQYTELLLASRTQEPWGVPRVAKRLTTRAGQTHTTEYTYSPPEETPFYFQQFHRPITITERGPSGTVQRRTQLTYKHFTGTLYVLALPASESTTIDGMTATKSWTYTPDKAFRDSETLFGITTTFARDTLGNVATVTRANGKATSFTYSWGTLSRTSTPGVVIDRTINEDGLVESETIAGRQTVYGYDALFRPTRTQPPTGSNPTITDYDNTSGRSVTVRRGTSFTTTTLDGFGRPVSTENSQGVRTRTAYDTEGRTAYQSYPFSGEFGGPDDKGTEFSYDPLGRPTVQRNPDNTTRTRQYDDANNRVTLRDEENHATVLTYRGFGHPDDARLIGVVDANQQPWSYTYDAIGNLAQVVTPTGDTRTWLHNTKGLVTSETHPESGTVQFLEYDPAGVLKRKMDARGTTFVYEHDDNDRVTRITAGTRVTTISYEPGSDNVIETSNGSVTTTLGYDAVGRPEQHRDVVGAFVFDTRYKYDGNDRVTGITYPSGRFVEYDHDTEGRIKKVFETAASRNYAFDMTYHPSGGLKTYTAGNNIQTSIDYHPNRYWIRSITAGPLQLTYSYDETVGNVLAITDARPDYSQTFTYDPLDRLTGATGKYGPAGYAYDAHGNRQSASGSTYTYDPSTLRLTSQNGIPFTYDSNGNLATKATNTTYTYTPENWLASVTEGASQTTYAYDADGWRARKTTATETTYYLRSLSGELLTEWHDLGSTGRVRDYVYVGTRLLSAIDRPQDLPSVCGGESIPDGLPHRVSIASGATGVFSFEGSACRRVSVKVVVVTGNLGCWDTRVQRNGTTIPNGTQRSCGSPGFLEPVVLPASGSYTVVVDPTSTGNGTVDIYVYDVVDVADAITPNAQGVTATLIPGQRFVLPFTGTVGHRMSVRANVTIGNFGCWWQIRIEKDGVTIPNGLQEICSVGPEIGFLEPVALPSNGVYTVVVDPKTYYTGTATVNLYDVVDVSDPITPNGTGITRTLTPGQRFTLPFSGALGHRMSVRANVTTGNFGCWWQIRIEKNGVTISNGLQEICSVGPEIGFLEPVALPSDGVYTVVVDPKTFYTGTATVNLYDVVDVSDPITPNGTGITQTLTPGQRFVLPFSGAVNHRMAVRANVTTGNFGCWWQIRIEKNGVTIPNGLQEICSVGPEIGFLEPIALPSDGVYTVVVDPKTYYTGTATVNLYDVVDVTDPITANSTGSTHTLTPGQRFVLPFSGAVNHRMSVKANVTTGNFGCWWEIRIEKDGVTIPNGRQQICSIGPEIGFLEPVALPSDGAYTVVVDPKTHYTGTATVNLHDVVDWTGSITPGGSVVAVSLDVPGQRAHLAFSGSGGHKVSATVRTTRGDLGCNWYILIQKDGSTITGGSRSSCSGINQNVTLGPVTLPTDGAYTVVVDPSRSSTGDADVTLVNVP